jgi:Fe-S cluster assembly ATP-binding protein
MKLLKPEIAMLDEIDSGLDVDALQVVASSIEDVIKRNGSALVVSHYARFYQMIKPTHVHVIVDGKILITGNQEIVERIDKQGFDWVKAEYGIDVNKVDLRPSSIGLCGVKERIKNAK